MSDETKQLTIGDLKILRAALNEVPVKGIESSRNVVAIADKLDALIATLDSKSASKG